MRKIVSLLLICVLVLSMSVNIMAAEKPIRVILKNYQNKDCITVKSKEIKFDVPPQIIDGRTMIPVRAVAEELGFRVDYKIESTGEQHITFFKYLYNSNLGLLSFIPDASEGLRHGECSVYSLHKQYAGFSDHMCNIIGRDMFYSGPNAMDYLHNAEGDLYDIDNYLELWKLNNIRNWMKNTRECSMYIGMYVDNQLLSCVNSVITSDGKTGRWTTIEPMDVPPQIVDGRTLMPLRAFGESLGMKVDWDGVNRIVTLSY